MFRQNDLILLAVIFLSMLAGILFPDFSSIFQPYLLYLMMFLLFLSFLPIKIGSIWHSVRHDSRTVLWILFIKLIILPVVIYYIFIIFYPSYALAALLLTGISTGVVAPFISGLLNANSILVLVMVVISSLIVPFSLPILVHILAGHKIEISFLGMMQMLCIVIFVPIITVNLLRYLTPVLLDRIMKMRFPISLIIFAIINLGVFSKYSGFFFNNPEIIIEATVIALLLGSIYVIAGIIVQWNSTAANQIAASIAFGNINNVLVIVFSSQFFGPVEPTLAAMYMIPSFGLILPLRAYQRYREQESEI